jgi:hypothetical protein
MSKRPDDLPEALSLTAICWLLDLTGIRINQLEREGVLEKTERATYTVESVRNFVRTMRQRGEGPRAWNQARTRLAEERAAAARLDRLEKQGELMPRSTVVSIGSAIAGAVRDKFLAMPGRVANQVAIQSNPAVCEGILYNMVCEVLEGIAGLEIIAEKVDEQRRSKAHPPRR